jgi:hypothetical protein
LATFSRAHPFSISPCTKKSIHWLTLMSGNSPHRSFTYFPS